MNKRESLTDLVKDVLELVLGQGRALDVFDSSELLSHAVTVLLAHWLHSLLA